MDTRQSRRLQCQLQCWLADHLREVEAARLRAGEPRQSIHLHFHFYRRLCYFIFGEEGYINANDPFDPDEFPSFGWRADCWREIREEQERQDAIVNTGQPAPSTGGKEPTPINEGQHTYNGADAPGDNGDDRQHTNQGPDEAAEDSYDQGSRLGSEQHSTPEGYDDTSSDLE
jgi:hypothetical protein